MNNLINKENYPDFYIKLEKILQKYHFKTPKIKLKKDDKHFFIKASMIPFSNSITCTTRSWNILNIEEKIATILHEIWHIHSKNKILYIIDFLLWFFVLYYAHFYLSFLPLILLEIFILRIPFIASICYISQHDEFSADKFSAENTDREFLKSALNKVSKETFPPHLMRIYCVFIWPFNFHPSYEERIAKLNILIMQT